MPEYKIEITKSAGKELQKIPRLEQNRIIKSIRSLAKDPRPAGAVKLTGDAKYRLRCGNYRILYRIKDEVVTVVVVKIGHRRDIYRSK